VAISKSTASKKNLFFISHLHKDFRNFYHKISLEKLAKSTNNKIGPLTINDFEDLKSA